MKKMFKLLENVNNYNTFCEVDQLEHVNGNQQDIYFRLIQKLDSCEECSGNRWLPTSLATVSVTFENLDAAKQITRSATMAFPNDDRSIFKVTILANESISGAMKLALTDGGTTESILLDGRLVASSTSSNRFYC